MNNYAISDKDGADLTDGRLCDIVCPREYFEPRDTLACGQVFRFRPCDGGGYTVYTADKACRLFAQGEKTHILCRAEDAAYFENYFDLCRDYKEIVAAAVAAHPALAAAAEAGKGIRILNQDREETFFSFLVSQNNNIPRIQGILERIAGALGEECSFMGETYHAFPSARALAQKDEAFYRALGAGYRAKFIAASAAKLAKEGFGAQAIAGKPLREALMRFPGVGPKVADCIALFAFRDTGAFPVDTWVEKVYREEFGGKEGDREQIAAYFSRLFGRMGGYFQQYLFYYKRGREGADGKHHDR